MARELCKVASKRDSSKQRNPNRAAGMFATLWCFLNGEICIPPPPSTTKQHQTKRWLEKRQIEFSSWINLFIESSQPGCCCLPGESAFRWRRTNLNLGLQHRIQVHLIGDCSSGGHSTRLVHRAQSCRPLPLGKLPFRIVKLTGESWAWTE